MTNSKIESITNKLNEYEWNILSNMSAEEGYTHFIKSPEKRNNY